MRGMRRRERSERRRKDKRDFLARNRQRKSHIDKR